MFCSNCGKPLDDGVSFCPYCGQRAGGYAEASFEEPEDRFDSYAESLSDETEYREKKKNPAVIVIIVLAVLLAAAIGIIVGMKGGSGSTPEKAQTDSSVTQEDSSGEVKTPKKEDFDSFADSLGSRVSADMTLVSTDVSEYPLVRLYYDISSGGDSLTFSSPEAVLRESVSGGEAIQRKIKVLQRLEGHEGLSIDLILDKSDSMYQDMDQVKSITNSFINSLDFSNGDQAELIAFDSSVMYMCMYTRDAALLRNGVSNMSTYGMTALYDALMEGVQNASYQTGARCVIAFTDGQDNESAASASDVISLANSLSVPIYIIGTSGADSSALTGITSATGGYYWNINTIGDMSQILNTIYTRQKGMYCVEYESDSSLDQYASRSIDFAVRDKTYGAVCRGLTFKPVRTLQKTSHSDRYEAVKGDVSWSTANTEAIKKGGHLATISSQAEMDKLTSLAGSKGLEFIWLGGYTSISGSNTYGHWVTGEPFSFTSWYPGEPSRNDKDGAEEMYIMLWKIKGSWSWNDQRNDPIHETDVKAFKGKSGYIIEYES